MSLSFTANETKTVYVVRDRNHEVLDVCELYTTADRLTTANVDKGAYFTQELGLRIGANWFYPGKLAKVTQADLRSNEELREHQEVKRKALKAGLSDDDIALLAGPKPKK
mgnify:CR=1 FL=1